MSEEEKPVSFEVVFDTHGPKNRVQEYLTTDVESFAYAVGQAGELAIFRNEYHATFAATTAKHIRIETYAPGTWTSVKVIKDETTNQKESKV